MLTPFFTSPVPISPLFLFTYLFTSMTIKDLCYCLDLSVVQCGNGSLPQALLSKQLFTTRSIFWPPVWCYSTIFPYAMMTNIKVCPDI